MGQLRTEKVQEFIKQELSKIILTELKDPRIGFVTVTRVDVTGDLRSAKAYVSLMGSAEEKTATWQALQKAVGHLRSEIGKRIKLRFSPELSLHIDESLEYGAHINELLAKLKREEADR
ncbi:MAG: 30S ribosome-binding factor RbfA [Sporomusaceae bacterium]|nr:30S ribosome-binding factor RbfA [Sporomusaceae bacterium]